MVQARNVIRAASFHFGLSAQGFMHPPEVVAGMVERNHGAVILDFLFSLSRRGSADDPAAAMGSDFKNLPFPLSTAPPFFCFRGVELLLQTILRMLRNPSAILSETDLSVPSPK
jgi:hypothetical protein